MRQEHTFLPIQQQLPRRKKCSASACRSKAQPRYSRVYRSRLLSSRCRHRPRGSPSGEHIHTTRWRDTDSSSTSSDCHKHCRHWESSSAFSFSSSSSSTNSGDSSTDRSISPSGKKEKRKNIVTGPDINPQGTTGSFYRQTPQHRVLHLCHVIFVITFVGVKLLPPTDTPPLPQKLGAKSQSTT